jgi:hypothetical protein
MSFDNVVRDQLNLHESKILEQNVFFVLTDYMKIKIILQTSWSGLVDT